MDIPPVHLRTGTNFRLGSTDPKTIIHYCIGARAGPRGADPRVRSTVNIRIPKMISSLPPTCTLNDIGNVESTISYAASTSNENHPQIDSIFSACWKSFTTNYQEQPRSSAFIHLMYNHDKQPCRRHQHNERKSIESRNRFPSSTTWSSREKWRDIRFDSQSTVALWHTTALRKAVSNKNPKRGKKEARNKKLIGKLCWPTL
jgi:hypothetical protein